MFRALHKQWEVAVLILINTSASIIFRTVKMDNWLNLNKHPFLDSIRDPFASEASPWTTGLVLRYLPITICWFFSFGLNRPFGINFSNCDSIQLYLKSCLQRMLYIILSIFAYQPSKSSPFPLLEIVQALQPYRRQKNWLFNSGSKYTMFLMNYRWST